MLTEFNFHAPSFVVAGRNSVRRSGELLSQWGAGQNIMVVCGSKTNSLGLLEPLLDSIRSEGFTPYVFHGSLPDAPVETVRSGIAYAKEHDVSAIVAFGGGSAMDTAKAIACMLDVEGDIVAYCKGLIKPTRRSKLLFAPVAPGQRAPILESYWPRKKTTSIFFPIPLQAPMWQFWTLYC